MEAGIGAAEEEESASLVGVAVLRPGYKRAGHGVEARKPRASWPRRIQSLLAHMLRRLARPWLPVETFPRPDPGAIRVGEPMTAEQAKEWIRSELPGPLERLELDRKLVMECLEHYNSRHPGDEYVPASGVVTKYSRFKAGACWTHGNFVARRKPSDFFAFLPTPRTLFFFELRFKDHSNEVVTCTPLDEPVTEACNAFGFPLGWGTRRNGRMDCICKTCYCRYDAPHRGTRKTLACGHDEVERACNMCYLRADVLHPFPGEFVIGNCKAVVQTPT